MSHRISFQPSLYRCTSFETIVFEWKIRSLHSSITDRKRPPRTLLIYSPIFSPINRPNILRIKNARARSVSIDCEKKFQSENVTSINDSNLPPPSVSFAPRFYPPYIRSNIVKLTPSKHASNATATFGNSYKPELGR